MQDEDVLTQVPPTAEELDYHMANHNDDENEKTAPPSPSLVPKHMHLPPLTQVPYPMDIMCLEELANAPVPDWKSLIPKHAGRYELFFPELKPGMVDHLEPNTYWVVGQDLDDCKYKIIRNLLNPMRSVSTAESKESAGTSYSRLMQATLPKDCYGNHF